MKNMRTVRAKILAGFIVVLIMGVILGAAGIISITRISAMSSEFDEIQATNTGVMNVLNAHYNWRHLLTEAVMNGTEFTGALDPATCALGKFIESPEAKAIRDDDILDMLAKIKEPHDFIHTNAKTVQSLIAANNMQEAKSYLNDQIMPKTAETINILNSMAERYQILSEDLLDKILVFENTMMLIIVLFLAVAVAAGIIISLLISNNIEVDLKNIVNKLSNSSRSINSSASQISEASENLATGTSKQAAAIEETSATMNETASMVSQNAENTKVASLIASEVTQSTGESSKRMTDLMNTMTELKESSDKVSRIVKTIDDIAFQTNLLAINATVEAARAGGDAGRSFAVVAQEVRSLAQRSASASQETTEIIEHNISLTDASRTEAEHVLSISEKNVQQITDLEKLISEINAASEEQSNGIKQINAAVSQMEKVTQENAAVAQQTSASANNMKDESGNLEELVFEASGMIKKTEQN